MKFRRCFLMIVTISLILLGYSLYTIHSPIALSETNVSARDSSTSFNSLSCEEKVIEYEKLVERILYKSIGESVTRVYGENQRTSWDYKIVDIKRGYYPTDYMYRVTIQFETFTGAHNPPFDMNIATYDIMSFDPFDIKEVNFEHYLENHSEEDYLLN